MSEIRVGENESLESALKRFKRKCARAGVLAEVRKREPVLKERRRLRLPEKENTKNLKATAKCRCFFRAFLSVWLS